MFRLAICDDERELSEELRREIEQLTGAKTDDVIDLFQDGKALLEECRKTSYDAVFLDVHMKESDGFAVAEELIRQKYETRIIFITSDNALVYRSFDFNPFYFLKKDDYKEVLPKVLKKLEKCMLHDIYLDVESTKEIKHLSLNDIYYIESDKHNVVVHTRKYSYTIRRKISELEQELGIYDFIRIQKGYLVNLQCVLRLNTVSEEVELNNHVVLKMSRRNKAEVEQAFRLYRRGMNVI